MSEIIYPPASFHFEVRIATSGAAAGAAADASFEEVWGIAVDMAAAEGSEGGENKFVHRLPTPSKHSNLVLKRGVMKPSSLLAQWTSESVGNGLSAPIQTQPLLVTLVDQSGSPLVSWTFADAYPLKLSVARLPSEDGDMLVDSVEFAYRSMERNMPGP
jgi:phage tail-like protein